MDFDKNGLGNILGDFLAIWSPCVQGCQMVCFQTKNPNLGKFLEGLAVENLGIFYDNFV
jgi:hypothetical protein